MLRTFSPQRYFTRADLLVLLLVGGLIYGVVAVSSAWRADFNPATRIDLSAWALPRYALLSAARGVVAYFISLAFTLGVGYAAAKSRRAERLLIPLLDILQSIPVLGFLPGLVLGLIAIFPNSNLGLELAAVLMIFTGQVWNMTFSFYGSLRSIPTDLQEAATIIGLGRWERFKRVELPFSAVNLVWNSLLSMAGGWFFLTVCEAFQLGDQPYRLPGIGAYMAVAIAEGNRHAMFLGVVAMALLIVVMDFVVWRPILSWVRRYRVEEVPGAPPAEPLISIMIRESRILRWAKVSFRAWQASRSRRAAASGGKAALPASEELVGRGELPSAQERARRALKDLRLILRRRRKSPLYARASDALFASIVAGLAAWIAIKLAGVLLQVPASAWVILLRNSLWTFLRVLLAVFLSTLWAVPVGIWIGTSARRTRLAQPIIQILASFPAPMLYPLAVSALFALGVRFSVASVFLMMLGVQWYVLFNVLAGSLKIPAGLREALSLMRLRRRDMWLRLYLPSVFPSLVTGWVIAAGGAWNASIVAEYMAYNNEVLSTNGLGATISVAAAEKDLPGLAASLTLMVLIVVLLNRTVWARLYRLAQTRFKMET
jgi:NitT/TauT family transport system permease protein